MNFPVNGVYVCPVSVGFLRRFVYKVQACVQLFGFQGSVSMIASFDAIATLNS